MVKWLVVCITWSVVRTFSVGQVYYLVSCGYHLVSLSVITRSLVLIFSAGCMFHLVSCASVTRSFVTRLVVFISRSVVNL